MTDENKLETRETIDADFSNAEDVIDEVVDAAGEESADEGPVEDSADEQPEPDEKDKRIAQLEAQLSEKDVAVKSTTDKLARMKGISKQLAKAIKVYQDEGYVDEKLETAAEKMGVTPQQLVGLLDEPDLVEIPTEARAKAVVDKFLENKDLLDEHYGQDTQEYLNAFDRMAPMYPELIAEYQELAPAKAVSFVVRKGKELLEKQKASEGLAERVKELEAKLAKYEGTSEDKSVKKALPLSGMSKPSVATGHTSNIMAVFGN